MKKVLTTTLFLLTMLAMAAAQQPGSAQSPSSPVPGANQQSMPGGPGQGGAQPGAEAPAPNAPVTEGCLGGTDPNYTITNESGTTYKLNIPPSADTSKLAPHVGESVKVAGNVQGKAIDVQGIGRGTSNCPAGGSNGAQTPPKH
jgi:hypothetical protein